MSEKFPQYEPDDEPQILSFEGLSKAFAKALSRKGRAPAEEDRDLDEVAENEAAAVHDSLRGEESSREATELEPVEASVVFDELSEEPSRQNASFNEAESHVSPHSILEAMLFVDNRENRPLEPARAAALMRGVEPEEIESIVDDLNREYRLSRCPYEIIATGGGFRLVLREAFYPVRDKFYGRVREARLSQAAIDILALVAYRQPISAEEINRLRDKPSGHILTQLVRRRLIRVERTESKPRQTLYYTTDRFLELFGLDDPSELPQIDEMDD